MSVKINPPYYTKAKSFELYKTELLAWRQVTDLTKQKQGIAIALSLPEDDSGIRAKVFEEIPLSDLNCDSGFEKLVEHLDKYLGLDELEDSLSKFEDFEDYQRKCDESINTYINNFNQKYQRIAKKGLKLPSEILAFKLLRRANITREEKMLVVTGMDYAKKSELYEQAQKSLKKFKGENVNNTSSGIAASPIKLEPAFLAENEEALWSAGYAYRGKPRGGRGYNTYRGRGNWRGGWNGDFSGTSSSASNQGFSWGRGASHRGGFNSVGNRTERYVNPLGPDGSPLTCKSCGSFRHLIRDCPDSWENLSKTKSVNQNECENNGSSKQTEGSTEYGVLFTGNDKSGTVHLGREARACAVLDSACSSTVCGQNWLTDYLETLSDSDRNKVSVNPGVRVFKFGGGTKLKSKAEYVLPAVIAGRDVSVRTDIVDSNIPLLLSRSAMKGAKIKLDTVTDSAEIFGQSVALNLTSSGHYCVPITREEESACVVNLEMLSDNERCKQITKLHRQFAHPPARKLVALMKDAGVWRDEFASDLEEIQQNCAMCKMYAVTPPRPVVAFPMASEFNEKVAMDLKIWGNKYILHMIDMWSRLTVSVFIDNKKTSTIIDKIMTNWVAVYGVMQAIMSDNGGEFNSDDMREIASFLNITVNTTAGESPWSNGLCERVHSVTDQMLVKLIAEYPDTSHPVLLGWANMARNSLQMWQGFSSYQLVYGKNPNLPNIMSDNVSALQGTTTCEVFAKHLNALHSARREFIQSEASERIRRALRGKVRACEQRFEHGDRVFYKREGKERWLGPGKVVFQDGKVVFVRHGGVFVRVSPNRLIKSGTEFMSELPMGEETSVDPGSSDSQKTGVPVSNGAIDTLGNDSRIEMDEIVSGSEESVLHDDNSGRTTTGDILTERDLHMPQEGSEIRFRMAGDAEWRQVTVLGRAGKASGKYRDWYNVADSSGGDSLSVDLNRVQWERVGPDEVYVVTVPRSRHSDPDCVVAKRKELEKLKDFDIYQEVENTGQLCISTRWVLWEKGDEIRARLVARGFEEESVLQSDSPTVGKSALRLCLIVAAAKDWPVKSTDIKSAFLQSRDIDREVYITPPKEAGVSGDKVWLLRRCLYGLNDAARQFYQSVVEVLTELGCINSLLDPSLFYKYDKSGVLEGILVSHIDDFLHAGSETFDSDVMAKLRQRFVAGRLSCKQFSYVGFQISQNNEGIMLEQNNYVQNIPHGDLTMQRVAQKQAELNCSEYTELRQIVGKLNWVVHGSRPDISYDVVDLSTKFQKARVEDLVQASRVILKTKQSKSQIFFRKLGAIGSWQITVYTDAALANLSDGVGSTGAFVILLVSGDSCCPISWGCKKIRRVVKSSLAAETLSLLSGVEESMYLRSIIGEVMNIDHQALPITAIVDCKSLVEAVNTTKMVEDKRLRIDLASIKECLDRGLLSSVRWCPGTRQLADCMTKKGASGHNLLKIFQTGLIQVAEY